jgi:flagellar hook protein FlgE
MAGEISTIQSLKAVDAWIDVINANINGGVRTAFKSSRLKFGGSNVDISRAGTSTSLPLQFPEPGLTTTNTVIDFSQGAITASTENTHLAPQGDGFFWVMHPSVMGANGGYAAIPQNLLAVALTRDGEFRTNQNGLLVNSYGWFLITGQFNAAGNNFASGTSLRAVNNNIDQTASAPAAMTQAVKLTDFIANTITAATIGANGVTAVGETVSAFATVSLGKQSLKYTPMGSTTYDFGNGTPANATVLSKSLEASNSSMTQSVPELSLAQKLFSALTKVLQTRQTNIDGVLNLVR